MTVVTEPEVQVPQLVRLGGLLCAWEAEAAAAHAARVAGRPRGAVTGLRTLDRELGGALAVGLHVLHAAPGIGKTAFALQAAASCGCPALFVTCEMSPLELFRRHTARVTNTYLGRLKSGELPPAESLALAGRGAAAAPLLAIADATRAPAPPAWLADAALATRGESEHLLVVLDSLHSWAEGAAAAAKIEAASEYDVLNAALTALRQLAAALQCAVLVVVERNRAGMERGGLSAGAGSRKIEYVCETLFELDRKDEAPPDPAGEVDIVLRVAKNRNGAPGVKLALRFNGALQRFTEA